MDRAPVLGDEVSIRVEELLIIGAVEAIAVDADRISVPQLEPYALWRHQEYYRVSIPRGRA